MVSCKQYMDFEQGTMKKSFMPEVVISRLFAFNPLKLLELESTKIADGQCKSAIQHPRYVELA